MKTDDTGRPYLERVGDPSMVLTPEVLWQRIEQDDKKHDLAHNRLRDTLIELRDALDSLEQISADNKMLVAKLETAQMNPVDVAKLRFTPQIVIGIITMAVTIAGGMWASTYGLRSDVRDILTRLSLQTELDIARTKLQDERAANLKDSIDSMRRRQELQQYEIQGVKDAIVNLKEGKK